MDHEDGCPMLARRPWDPREEDCTCPVPGEEEGMIVLLIQVNGKSLDRIPVPVGTEESEEERLALASAMVQLHLAGREPTGVVCVPCRLGARLVNLVVPE